MTAHVLTALGRTHDPTNVASAVRAARDAGFESFNLDLIYGGVGESLDDWKRTLADALALEPPHVSAYALTVEPGTPLADTPERHPDDDDQADKYIAADEALSRAGLDSVRDLELGASRIRVSAQPSVLVAGELSRCGLRRALTSSGIAVVERAHA